MTGLVVLLTVLYIVSNAYADDCVPRDYGNGGTVCVCNSTYCDFTPEVDLPHEGEYLLYTSSKAGLRMQRSVDSFSSHIFSDTLINVSTTNTYQTIFGFGGAFTDAAGINMDKLSKGARSNLLKSYFSVNGSRYNFGRVPIAGSDFSTTKYTYDDTPGDVNLTHFSLNNDDVVFKIPYMQEALKLNPDLRFFAAAWTAPPWMKTNNAFVGIGFLKPKYYQVYANYLMKFLDDYEENGLKMWAVSTGNEPSNGIVPISGFNSMGWTPVTLANWVANNLGPTLRSSRHNETLILALDDQRFNLPWFVNEMFENEAAKNYTDGIAVHWYWDQLIPPGVQSSTHKNFPDKFIIMTEASIGDKPWEFKKVLLGSWKRGQAYVLNIIQHLTYWAVGWVDWNLALDQQGGPNWKKNFVDSPVIVNATADEFYKQPLFYAVAHFSRFIPRGSVRIDVTQRSDIPSVAFVTPKKEKVVVLYNKLRNAKNVTIHDAERGNINIELPAYSISTILYQ